MLSWSQLTREGSTASSASTSRKSSTPTASTRLTCMNLSMEMTSELTYRATGVDPTRAQKSLAQVRERIARTRTPEVIGDIGAFGGLFASPGADRVLVATTDGVGTKLEIARLLDRHEVIGTDLVHHCVNDAMAMGAEPLFFLDYFSTSRIEPAVFTRVVGAMADACAAHRCALLGGETAEMPGTYGAGAYDLAGFLV